MSEVPAQVDHPKVSAKSTKGVPVPRPQLFEDTPQREAELRQAHRRAFEKIRAASTMTDYQRLVAAAVEELVDACEAYAARTA